MPNPHPPPPSESLGASVRQARRELWVMLGAWLVFFLWVTLACHLLAPVRTGDGSVPTLFGFPRWVGLGVALPWLTANLFIGWFCFRFMKDTPLEELDTQD